MRINRTKKIFIFTAVCAILLPFLVLFAVPPAYAEPQPLSPEQQRLMKELEEAKKSEEVSGKARAEYSEKCGWYEFRCVIESAISDFLNGVVGFVVSILLFIPGYLLDWMVVVNLNGAMYNSGFITAGWGISRDVANMFFIFFVLWMALATIFQFDSYSAKRLLPKLIIVALLVNFSLPIGLFIIRTSNAIGKTFYLAATNGNSLANTVASNAKMKSTKQVAEFTDENLPAEVTESDIENCTSEIRQGGLFQQAIDSPDPSSVATNIASIYDQCSRKTIAVSLKSSNGGILFYGMIAAFWKLIIGIVAAFVFLAGAFFLLVRYLSLVILLIFGPLAFLFMILPATQEHWNKWWNKLIQWSFFMPAFMFMIMLSTRLSHTLLAFQLSAAQTESNNIASLGFQYLLTMSLFIASLMVANSMGIAMSGTVVGWGRSMARGAGKYAKGASFRGAARMGGAYAKMALETPQARRMAATPLVRGLLRPLEAAVGAKRGVEEERAKQIANAVRSGNPAYAAARLQGERATVQAAYLRSASKDDIQKLEQGMGAGAMGVMMNQLKSIAPELGKKIGQSFKDIDLRIAAAKGVAIGTPEFERAREEYMSEQTPYALGQILTAENLQKQWVQKYLLARGGEKEINAITQTGEQIRGLASIFEQWGDAEMRNNTQLGNEIRQNIAMGQSFGYSPEQARRETMISYLPELFEKQAQQMGIATNQALQKWAQAAPARVMLGEGRVIQRGTDMDELLRRLSGGGGTAPQSPPPGGPATQ